jgi:hypothetical protein
MKHSQSVRCLQSSIAHSKRFRIYVNRHDFSRLALLYFRAFRFIDSITALCKLGNRS